MTVAGMHVSTGQKDFREKLMKKLIEESGFGEDNVEEFCVELKEFYCINGRSEECYDQCISRIDSDVINTVSDEITNERIEISWNNNPQSTTRLNRSILYGYLGNYDVHVVCVQGYTKSRGGEDFEYCYCLTGGKEETLQVLKEEIEDLEAIIEKELKHELDPSWKNIHRKSLREISEIKKVISVNERK